MIGTVAFTVSSFARAGPLSEGGARSGRTVKRAQPVLRSAWTPLSIASAPAGIPPSQRCLWPPVPRGGFPASIRRPCRGPEFFFRVGRAARSGRPAPWQRVGHSVHRWDSRLAARAARQRNARQSGFKARRDGAFHPCWHGYCPDCAVEHTEQQHSQSAFPSCAGNGWRRNPVPPRRSGCRFRASKSMKSL